MVRKESKSKIRNYFRKYSSNLSSCFPEAQNIFICPICQKNFDEGAIENNDLSLEHIIPLRLGGRLTTLTCKDCNNAQGANLDAHLIKRLNIEDIFSGKSKSPLRSQIKIGDGRFMADVYLSKDGPRNIQVVGIPKASDPKLRDLAVENLEKGIYEINMTGKLGYKDLASRVAVIRIAYLMMFSVFGYGYIQADTLDLVRDQIVNFNEEKLPLKGVVILNEPPFFNKIGLLTQPSNLRSFFVILKLKTNSSSRFLGVALPGLDKESFSLYERWGEGIKNIAFPSTAKIDVLEFTDRFISDSRLRFASKAIWDDLIKIGGPAPE